MQKSLGRFLELYTTDDLFSDPQYVMCFRDCVCEATGEDIPETERLRGVFETLPENTREIAYQWGMADFIFADEAIESLTRPS